MFMCEKYIFVNMSSFSMCQAMCNGDSWLWVDLWDHVGGWRFFRSTTACTQVHQPLYTLQRAAFQTGTHTHTHSYINTPFALVYWVIFQTRSLFLVGSLWLGLEGHKVSLGCCWVTEEGGQEPSWRAGAHGNCSLDAMYFLCRFIFKTYSVYSAM